MTMRDLFAGMSEQEFAKRAAQMVGATEEEAARLRPMVLGLLERAEYINSFAAERGMPIDEGLLSETIAGGEE